MKHHRLLVFSLCLMLTGLAQSGEPVFDSHVHLREGETSLQKFEAEVRTSGIELAGVGAMWFGGPHQALAGDPAKIRAGNDGLIALAAKHPEVAPIGTVHPYDGQAALDELVRIAARGVKTLKIHPHTQRFEISDPRVLALAGKVRYVVDPDNPYPQRYTGHVRMTLTGGRVVEERQPHIRGGMHEPLSREDLERKFLGNLRFGGVDDARANRLLDQLSKSLDGPLDLAALRG